MASTSYTRTDIDGKPVKGAAPDVLQLRAFLATPSAVGGFKRCAAARDVKINSRIWIKSVIRMSADTPAGRLQWTNRLHPPEQVLLERVWYGTPVMGHLMDFALAVRDLKKSEFDDEDALMAMMMEVGARESALCEGRRIHLPLEGETEADACDHERLKVKYNADPLDMEAMLSISYSKP